LGRFTDDIIAELQDGFSRTMESVGGEMVADIRESISVPVQYRGGYIIRSAADGQTPPRYETGALWRGVQMVNTVDRGAATATLAVYVDRQGGHPMVPQWLDQGTKKMVKRPYFYVAFVRWVPRVLAALGV
jgi:hypothetical protein